MKKHAVLFLILSTLALGAVVRLNAPGGQEPTTALMERLIRDEGLDEARAAYLRELSPPLFSYLRAISPAGALEPIYKAATLAELRSLLEKKFGRDVLDLGAKMFEYFEGEAGRSRSPDRASWKHMSSERLVFFFRPGSQAEDDLEFIMASSADALAAITLSLDIGAETARAFDILHVELPPGASEAEKVPDKSRICVYLHPSRASGGERLKRSMGGMSFGATILSEGQDKGAGRLTARIDVLYLNALSLAVLHHEISHAALFLGSFDPTALTANPLRGEPDLRKAFFAGYKPIPPFLHEGIGDHVLYFQVIYPRWPLFPPVADLVRAQLDSREFIPLSKLFKEGANFRAQHRRTYALEAASVVDFLIRGHGAGKLKAWFQSPDKDALRAFEKIYGFSVTELERSWRASLAAEPRT